MQSTDRDRVFVADLAGKRARLSEANIMRLRSHAAAHDARLGGDELAVLLIAQADSSRSDETTVSFWFLGRVMGAPTAASISSTKICSLAVAEFGAERPSRPIPQPKLALSSIDASLSLKALSTQGQKFGGD